MGVNAETLLHFLEYAERKKSSLTLKYLVRSSRWGGVLYVYKAAHKKNNLHSLYSSILAIMLMSLAHVPLQSKKAYTLFKAFN